MEKNNKIEKLEAWLESGESNFDDEKSKLLINKLHEMSDNQLDAIYKIYEEHTDDQQDSVKTINQANNSDLKEVEDIWNRAYKNFLHMSYFLYFIFFGLLLMSSGDNSEFSKLEPSIRNFMLAQVFVMATVWLGLSQLFKKRHKNAVIVGYIFLGIIAFLALLQGNIIGILIDTYFFYLVYKVSQVSTENINKVN